LQRRVARARRRLSTAFTVDAALTALSWEELDALREIESAYVSNPGPAATIRERIAEAHVRWTRLKAVSTTQAITTDTVGWWAQDILDLFLAGLTDGEPETGNQYRIELLRPASAEDVGSLFEVSTVLKADPRQFRVTVVVEEVEQ
jgi:hypothetical protein